ncbi:ABC transporter substrate-binding protein [Alcaligenaceae bacterium CGII-47]|nr:ABC transporter substrate-binding protein [Alcaligenaceae bacterium CGII-47]
MMKLFSGMALVLFAAFSLNASATTTVPASANQEEIRFGVGLDPAFSPIYYAAQNGLFEKEGLNVKLQLLAQAADAADAIVAGQNQVGGGSESTILTRATRGDVQAFAIYGKSDRYIKLAVRKGIEKPQDIKKFGVVPGSSSDFVSRQLIKQYGMDPSQIEWVKAAPPEFPALLARGDVDAYFLWEPWPTRALSVGGTILLNSGDVGYTYNMLAASTKGWLDANPDQARAIVRALNQACVDIRADPEKAVIATQQATKIPLDQARKLLQDVDCVVSDFTPEALAMYEEVADFQYNNGGVSKRADVPATMRSGFVPDNVGK